MRDSKETYREVAKNCSAYKETPKRECVCNAEEDRMSCLNCRHFTEEEYCVLDLFDPIKKRIQ